MKIVIPLIPNSLNTYIGRNNVWEYREEKQKWIGLGKIFIKEPPTKPFDKAHVKIEYFFHTRQGRDPDNYAGKVIMDMLTKSGVIANDTFKCVTLSLHGNYDKNNPRTEITVTEVGK